MAELIKNIGGIINSANHTCQMPKVLGKLSSSLTHLCPIIQGEKIWENLKSQPIYYNYPLSQQLTVLRNENIVSVRKSS
jgi:hypothetical protein